MINFTLILDMLSAYMIALFNPLSSRLIMSHLLHSKLHKGWECISIPHYTPLQAWHLNFH